MIHLPSPASKVIIDGISLIAIRRRRKPEKTKKGRKNDKGSDGDEHAREASNHQILPLSATGEAAGAHPHRLLRPDNVSNFVNASSIFGPDCQLVYKHYATLYFVFVYDSAENELAMLDLIQVFVETLDKCFKNVCELDVVFNYSKIHTILDEIIFAGQVLETSSMEIMRAVEEISKLEAASVWQTR
ncbi:AP-3 complex subunit sigma-like protein [Drosera capensis]